MIRILINRLVNGNEIIGLIMLKSWGIKKLPHPQRQFFSEQFA